MASTVLGDVIEPEVFAAYTQELSLELSLLVKSGVIARNPALDSFLAGGGRTIEMPRWQDLDDTESNVSDDSGTAVIQNIGTRNEIAVRHNRNQTWGSMDLVSQLAGSDAMDAIARRVAQYWVRQDQKMILEIIKGLILEDADADSESDIMNDIAAPVDTNATAANMFSADALLDTFQKLGDHKDKITAIGVHSVIHTEMQKQNLIDFTPDSEGNVGFGTYLGKSLLVDDGLTVDPSRTAADMSTVQPMYTTVCYAPGAFQLGVGSPRVAAEVDRNALSGNGGGEEYLVSRREFVLHPVGFTWAGTSAGPSPLWSELSVNGAYNLIDTSRVKDVRLAILRTN